jgi:hypothetical protein
MRDRNSESLNLANRHIGLTFPEIIHRCHLFLSVYRLGLNLSSTLFLPSHRLLMEQITCISESVNGILSITGHKFWNLFLRRVLMLQADAIAPSNPRVSVTTDQNCQQFPQISDENGPQTRLRNSYALRPRTSTMRNVSMSARRHFVYDPSAYSEFLTMYDCRLLIWESTHEENATA